MLFYWAIMIFTFWEGVKPAYIELCMETWKFPCTVLNYGNLHNYTDMPLDRLKRFTLPQIADCVRAHVLRDHGGYWLDADTIMVGDKLPDAVILGDNEKRINTCGFLHAPIPQMSFFKEWSEYQDRIINADSYADNWDLMANAFTDRYLRAFPEIFIGSIYPYWLETDDEHNRRFKYVDFYFRHSYQLADLKTDSMIMLHNQWTPKRYKRRTREEVFECECTLTNILRALI